VGTPTDLDPDAIATDEATLSQVFDQAWMGMVVGQARALLESRATGGEAATRRLRCLKLRYEEELQPQDIAERLGLKPQAVYDLLKQARQEFKSALFEVLASYNPTASEKELEDTCRELAAYL
jgi:DNA-directed RNA polymerase specialized sigma24 family protein